jgi:pimeloyl-ACP methyl ester carboxylesterase
MECKLESTTVHYQAYGEGRPLIMLHGGYGDHQYLSMSIEPLFENRPGWRRIYPDLPGQGRTVAPEWLGTADQVLDVLLDFVAHVIPGQRFSVGGYSWGGYLTQGIVYRRAADLDGVLLITPRVHAYTESKPEQTVLVKDETLLAGLDGETKEWVGINVV